MHCFAQTLVGLMRATGCAARKLSFCAALCENAIIVGLFVFTRNPAQNFSRLRIAYTIALAETIRHCQQQYN